MDSNQSLIKSYWWKIISSF